MWVMLGRRSFRGEGFWSRFMGRERSFSLGICFRGIGFIRVVCGGFLGGVGRSSSLLGVVF